MSEKADAKKGQPEDAGRKRDDLLLRLLKTPPQPRPKRERGEKPTSKRKPKKEAPAK